jgi:3-hydroxyacyl-[acyl-carrier-protein] dehydratase
MRFWLLIDRIVQLQPGASITAVKALALSDEYLEDHFPLFPVMPGVLMLECMYQTGAWLVRKSDDFASSMVVLREARNVKFADFVQPGQVLRVTAELQKRDGALTWLKAQGTVDGALASSARIVLQQYNLADTDPAQAATDDYTRRQLIEQFRLLYRPHEAADEGVS